jgi:hypothetical protein
MPDTPQQDAKGRFVTGNSGGGRPKGARAKLGEEFLKTMLADYEKHGAAAVEIVRETKPADYLKVIASILPKEFDLGEETVDVLSTLLGRIDGRTRSVLPPESNVTHVTDALH